LWCGVVVEVGVGLALLGEGSGQLGGVEIVGQEGRRSLAFSSLSLLSLPLARRA
jgi:hypothetical protein